MTVPALLGLARALQSSISYPKVAFQQIFSKEECDGEGGADSGDEGQNESERDEEGGDIGAERMTKLFTLVSG